MPGGKKRSSTEALEEVEYAEDKSHIAGRGSPPFSPDAPGTSPDFSQPSSALCMKNLAFSDEDHFRTVFGEFVVLGDGLESRLHDIVRRKGNSEPCSDDLPPPNFGRRRGLRSSTVADFSSPLKRRRLE